MHQIAQEGMRQPIQPERAMRALRRTSRPSSAGMTQWRLERAIDFIGSQYDEPLTLAQIASVAGLSRMHFAALFRRAMGVRPHEYLLRCRIERAQEMLLRGENPLVAIALAVGFQTQSHFTSVFKRLTGKPPRAWRAHFQAERSRPGCALANDQSPRKVG